MLRNQKKDVDMVMRKIEKLIQKSIKLHLEGKEKQSRLCSYIIRIIFSSDIVPTSKIHPTTHFVHNGLGCVIHPKADIGPNCRIYQNVTLGGNGKLVDGLLTNQGGPTLEEGVTIFSGACVLGPVIIGKGAVVGANAVVLSNVPPNTLAVGVPAVIKPLENKYNF